MPEGHGTRLTLRPPRAMTAPQFVALFAVLSGAMWLTAGLSWLVGNAFAPAFALLHSAVLAAALRWLWREGDRDETIAVGPDAVEVRRSAQAEPVFRAHPYWVRLNVGGDARVMLRCSGKNVEVGAFLGPDERRELVRRLQELLAAAGGRDR